MNAPKSSDVTLFSVRHAVEEHYPNGYFRQPFSYLRYVVVLLIIGYLIFNLPIFFDEQIKRIFDFFCFIVIVAIMCFVPRLDRYFFPAAIEKAIDKQQQQFNDNNLSVSSEQRQYNVYFAIKNIKSMRWQVRLFIAFWVILLCEIFFLTACVENQILFSEPIWISSIIDGVTAYIGKGIYTYAPDEPLLLKSLPNADALLASPIHRLVVLILIWQVVVLFPYFCLILLLLFYLFKKPVALLNIKGSNRWVSIKTNGFLSTIGLIIIGIVVALLTVWTCYEMFFRVDNVVSMLLDTDTVLRGYRNRYHLVVSTWFYQRFIYFPFSLIWAFLLIAVLGAWILGLLKIITSVWRPPHTSQ